jgi:predicted ATP-grasp superfamily ATP-dependent carboligase
MAWTLGSHSRYLAKHIVTPPPRYDSAGFAAALLRTIDQARIDWLIPTSEEVFFVARHYETLAEQTNVFTEPLRVLHTLHHKYLFQQLCASLGIQTPRTAFVQSRAELEAMLPAYPAYLLKPAYSRFATRIITNCGPRAGELPLSQCQPSVSQPWLLQEYITGEGICTYSTLHKGHVTAHCAYVTPYKVNHGSGVQFVTVDGHATLTIVQRIGAALDYTGQMSLDLIAADNGLYLLECNPRATSGVHVMSPRKVIGGLTNASQSTWIAPPGQRKQISLALLMSGASQPRRLCSALRDAATVRDVVFTPTDPLPALVQLRAGLDFAAQGWRKHISMVAAMTDDIEWNGEGSI